MNDRSKNRGQKPPGGYKKNPTKKYGQKPGGKESKPECHIKTYEAIDESKVWVNHFKLEPSENTQAGTIVYQYNVEKMIRSNPTGNESSIALPRRYLKSCVDDAVRKLRPDLGNQIDKLLAFDRETTNFILVLKLFDFQNVEGDENLTQEVAVEVENLDVIPYRQNLNERQKIKAKITLKFLKEIPLLDVLQRYEAPGHAITKAYDLVLKNDHPDKRHLKNSLGGRGDDIGVRLKLWTGLFFKACPGTNNLYAKVDVTFKAQWKELTTSNINLKEEVVRLSLKGLNVKCKKSEDGEDKECIYKVNSVVQGRKILRRPKTIKGKEATTVKELISSSLSINVQDNDLFLHVGPVKRELYFRLADCTIAPNQANFKVLNTTESKNMVDHASLCPKSLYQDIMKLLVTELPKERLDPFGFKISKTMESFDMRKLPPPKLMYENREKEGDIEASIDKKGKWSVRSNFIFKTAGKSVKRALIVPIREGKRMEGDIKEKYEGDIKEKLTTFAKHFKEGAQRWKIGIDELDTLQSRNIVAGSTLQLLEDLEAINIFVKSKGDIRQTGKKFDMIIAITPKSKEYHACVKRVFEVESNILTQCITWDTFVKTSTPDGNTIILNNMMLKLNAKLNGVNHVFKNRNNEARLPGFAVLVMGAVIGSPIRESKASKVPHSIATVTCNIDEDLFRYSSQWRLQKSESGEILDLKSMVKWHLENYKTPSSLGNRENLSYIIFYRDCSEAVVNEKVERVYKSELKAIKEAVKEFLGVDGNIRIVYVLVQRPNHTKFFYPAVQFREDTEIKNVEPGVIVDSIITHPSYYNFFLLSHSGPKGTMKPTEYTIMSHSPEEKTENDRLAQLTYSLCFMYSRCNQSIPVPAPVCYAQRWSGKALTYVLRHNLNWNNAKDCARLGVIMNERTTELLKKTFKSNYNLSNIDPFC